jgi:hypothetical protein
MLSRQGGQAMTTGTDDDTPATASDLKWAAIAAALLIADSHEHLIAAGLETRDEALARLEMPRAAFAGRPHRQHATILLGTVRWLLLHPGADAASLAGMPPAGSAD